ncbi:MAG: putative quinol monooxygenase [Halioglobus sp.]
MIVVNVTVEIDPQHLAAMKEGIAAMETASCLEAGCLDYCFSVEVNDPSKLRITEKWESKEALFAHFTEPHMAAFQALIANYPPKGMEAFFYEAEAFTPPGM